MTTAASASTGVQTVAGYAHALLDVARAESVLDHVEDELYLFARTLESTPDLWERLADPGLEMSARLDVVDQLLAGKAHPQTLSAIAYIVQSGRARLLPEIADEVVRVAAEERNRAIAQVRTAVPLDDTQKDKLVKALAQSSGREIELKVVIDPKVVGGLVVKIGDTVYDVSIARRLEELRARLASG